MNKSEMIKKVAKKSKATRRLSQKDVAEAWRLCEETMLETLIAGEKVQLSGFGTFTLRERCARKGRNPKTGAVVRVAACKKLAFIPAKSVKESLK